MFDIETAFFAVVGIPIAALILLHIVNFIFRSLTASAWRTTPGTIEESSLQHDLDGDPYLELRYKFHIDGQPYWGNQRMRLFDRATVDDKMREFAIGAKINVEFHPDDPENQSVLETSDQD